MPWKAVFIISDTFEPVTYKLCRINKEVKDSENFPHQQPQFYCIEWKTLHLFVNISSIFSIKTVH